MRQLTIDSKYIDIVERSMYNGALAGIWDNRDAGQMKVGMDYKE